MLQQKRRYPPARAKAPSHLCLVCGNAQVMIDSMNNRWCEAHKIRFELINWGKEHNWPALEFSAILMRDQPVDTDGNRAYAVAATYTYWFTACAIGSDAYMMAMHAYVFGESDL